MKCPFCPEDKSEDFTSEMELQLHILRDHPEKAMTADAYGRAMGEAMRQQQLYNLASNLTHTSIGSGGADKETVLERFRFFVRALYKVFRGERDGGRTKG
jgi:hypothetical protein